MEYKVIKKFYDPFLNRRVAPGELINVADENLKSYLGHIAVTGVIKEPIQEPTQEPIQEPVAPVVKKAPPRKAKKVGDK